MGEIRKQKFRSFESKKSESEFKFRRWYLIIIVSCSLQGLAGVVKHSRVNANIFILGALYPSMSGLMHKHIVKHLVERTSGYRILLWAQVQSCFLSICTSIKAIHALQIQEENQTLKQRQ